MSRLSPVAVIVVLILTGCGGKKPSDDDTGSASASPSTRKDAGTPPEKTKPTGNGDKPNTTGLPPAPPRLSSGGKSNQPEPEYVPFGKWSRVGDVQVRIDKAEVRKPILIGDRDTESTGSEVELVLTFSIENISKTKKLEYHRWRSSFGDKGSKLTDEHGNDYRNSTSTLFSVKGGQAYGTATIYPGDPTIVDIITFQRPVSAATELKLVLPALTSGETGRHGFRIPASAWK